MTRLWVAITTLIAVVTIGFLDPFGFFEPNKHEQELVVLRAELLEYSYNNGKLPENLKAYFGLNPNSILRHSFPLKEVNVFDGTGGWYYDSQKMLLGLNNKKYKNTVVSLDPAIIHQTK